MTEQQQKILAVAEKKLSQKERALYLTFLSSYYALASDDDLAAFTAESLFATAYNHFKRLQDFDGKVTLVDAYNPSQSEHGYGGDCSVLDVITPDRSFLIDSIQMLLVRRNLGVQFVTHPIYRFSMSGNNKLASLEKANESRAQHVSVIHIEFDKLPADQLKDIAREVLQVIEQITFATNDWQLMGAKVADVIKGIQNTRALPQTAEEVMETISLLEWLQRQHFTFLGYRQYEVRNEALHVIPRSGLGVMRDDGKGGVSQSFARLPKRLQQQSLEPRLLLFSKSNNLSVIHRPVYMDFIGIKKFDDQGRVIGEHRFLGLLTAEAYRLLPREIPLISHKIEQIINETNLPANSYVARRFNNILTQFPRDELFQADSASIRAMAIAVLQLRERHILRFLLRKDIFETYVACYIYIPRERYNTRLRQRFEAYLVEKFSGFSSEFSTYFSESLHVRVKILVRTIPGEVCDFDPQKIEADFSQMMLNWNDESIKVLQEKIGKSKGNSLFKRFEKAIPGAYKDDFSPNTAADDLLTITTLNDEQPLGIKLYQGAGDSDKKIHLKLYGLGNIAELSELLPVLENFGFIVTSNTPYQFEQQGDNLGWLIDFRLRLESVLSKPLHELAPNFIKAFTNTWSGVDVSDGFDRLVMSTGLCPRDITMLRAVSKYMVQAQAPFSNVYMQHAINNNSDIAVLLVELFHARMGLKTHAREELAQTIVDNINIKLAKVDSLDEDRIMRWFTQVIGAMVRTNFFQPDADGKDKTYLSFKIESAKIVDLPLPKPKYEIFVHSADVEGIHLRGGKVARGGIRWSDRFEDFRTEVLGLVKAQIVKNAVIVPVGSKGGFVVQRRDNSSREAFINEGIRCYKIFIRGLLDITDNIVSAKITPPQNVYRHDDDDPYLVVAADKGTANFSDIANDMAKEYGFWLGDAFASGGSVGYDHKGMGITARGAWESVKRHFRHLGKDIQHETFTVVGIGDMSGDVFGNGMLLSDKIQLTAAFNHLHVFIDPTPDAATTYKERQRLFAMPRSSWADFDTKLISKGGGVFSRRDKSINISTEMKSVFAISEDKLSPDQLIKCLLKAPIDLLWNGGIGTYVKASSESHVEVGDKANDALRVNGDTLNFKVIGEGGNLGLTQLGRIEFAKKGGLVLTDAIDNSAGVNCSDYEVNIKILLNQAVENGNLTVSGRNKLLESMTDEVARSALRQNYQQPQTISIGTRNKHLFVDHIRIIRHMEKSGYLNRELGALPSDAELKKRLQANQGLYGPELAVLLAYSKINLFEELIASDLPDAHIFQDDLTRYFPTLLREKYAHEMQNHRLHREIIATFITNSILNHMGVVFIYRTKETTGQSSEQIVRAYCVARNIFKARTYWNRVDGLDNKVNADLQNDLHLRIRHTLEQSVNWFLSHRRGHIDIEALQSDFADTAIVARQLPEVLSAETVEHIKADIKALTQQKVPEDLAHDLAYLPYVVNSLDIVSLASKHRAQLADITAIYYGVSNKLQVDWLSDGISTLYNNDFWRRRACRSLVENMQDNIAAITERTYELNNNPQKALEILSTKYTHLLQAYDKLIGEIHQGELNLSRLSVAIGEMSSLVRSL